MKFIGMKILLKIVKPAIKPSESFVEPYLSFLRMKQQGVSLYPSLVGMPVYGRFPFPVFHPVFLPFF